MIIIKKFLTALVILLIICIISFFLLRAMKGGPFDEEKDVPKEVKINLEKKFKIRDEEGKPIPISLQLINYLAGVIKFDFGPSYKYTNWSVKEVISTALPVSITLGIFALTLALFFGVLSGLLCAYYQASFVDKIIMNISSIGVCIPNFVSAPLLVILFSFMIPIFPPAGWTSFSNVILPSFVLSLPYIAYISRLMRNSIVEELRKDYVKTALAKGFSKKYVVLRHCLRNALLPIVTYLGPASASILTGSFVVENFFAIPGLGTHFINSAKNCDYTLAMGTVITYSTILVFLNMFIEILYAYINPITREEK